jgi:hypothetical protein
MKCKYENGTVPFSSSEYDYLCEYLESLIHILWQLPYQCCNLGCTGA